VKNARTNTNLTFIDGELKAFETKIKDGNLHPNLPEAYFLWNSEIEHILSLIILGWADSNLKCNTLGFNERGLNVAGC
jgi:hypothetical protein